MLHRRKITPLELAFIDFHASHPEVYDLFIHFTRRVLERGYTRHSARDIIHRVRWETTIERTDIRYKINNNWSPYYARMWMRDHRRWGFFEIRELTNGRKKR